MNTTRREFLKLAIATPAVTALALKTGTHPPTMTDEEMAQTLTALGGKCRNEYDISPAYTPWPGCITEAHGTIMTITPAVIGIYAGARKVDLSTQSFAVLGTAKLPIRSHWTRKNGKWIYTGLIKTGNPL